MTREDEINPARQRGVSVDVLAERLSNLHEQNRSEFSALHHHFNSLEVKVDAYVDKVASIESALHEHVSQQHHMGTRDRLLEMSNQHLQFERKFGDIDHTLSEMEKARLVEKAASEARQKQRNQGLTALDKAVGFVLLTIPIIITLVRG